MEETERILENQAGELPPKTGLKISAREVESPLVQLNRVLEVVSAIVNSEGKSLTDEEWEDTLPSWFVDSMVSRSLKEIKVNENLWHFGSWIDAIQQRGWKWWSSITTKDGFSVYLESLTYPYNIDPFIYVIYSTGVERKNIIIEELL